MIATLIEDYKRRINTAQEYLDTHKSNGSINDLKKFERINTQMYEYRTFVAELSKLSNLVNLENDGMTNSAEFITDNKFDVEACFNSRAYQLKNVKDDIEMFINNDYTTDQINKHAIKLANEFKTIVEIGIYHNKRLK